MFGKLLYYRPNDIYKSDMCPSRGPATADKQNGFKLSRVIVSGL